MEPENKKVLWWKPAFEVFGRVSVWVVVPIIAALILGKRMDEVYDTSPWLFLALSGAAFLISSFGIVHTVIRYVRNIEKEKR